MAFPTTPTNGQQSVVNGITYQYASATNSWTRVAGVANTLSASGNITGGNLITGGLITSVGNITGGNILTAGLMSSTGNVTGNYINGNGSALTGISTFSNITVTGGSYIAANTISTLLTLVAGNNIVLTANNTSKSLQIDYSSSGGTSIFATGGDMGLVTEVVTSSEDLGDVITASTTAYDLGVLGVQGVVSNSDIVANTITGDKINSSTYISITGNLAAANLAMTSSKTDVRGLWIGNGNSFSASSQSSTSSDVMLSSNGLKAYVLASAGSAYQYSLLSAYSANGASYDNVSFSFVSQDSGPQSIARDSTDSVAWMLGGQTATIYQYTYGATANIGSLAYSGLSFSVASQEPTPTGIAFNTDQSYVYVVGTTNKNIYQYQLGTPGNIATALYTTNSYISVAGQDSQPTGISFSEDGLTMYMTGAANQCVYQYTLTSSFDITTGVTYNNQINIASQDRYPSGLYTNFTKGYAYTTGLSTNNVYQFNIGNSTVITANATYQTGNLTVGNINITGNILQNGNAYATMIQAMTYALAF